MTGTPEKFNDTHVTRYSDSSFCDEVCLNCGATDIVPGGWGKLAEPCSAMTALIESVAGMVEQEVGRDVLNCRLKTEREAYVTLLTERMEYYVMKSVQYSKGTTLTLGSGEKDKQTAFRVLTERVVAHIEERVATGK